MGIGQAQPYLLYIYYIFTIFYRIYYVFTIFPIDLLYSLQWGSLPCRLAGARAMSGAGFAYFFHFSVFFSLFGPLRRQARVQACPGQGQAQAQPYMRSRLSVFFSLSRIFSLLGPFRGGSPLRATCCPARPRPRPISAGGIPYFFHFPDFFHFWPEVKNTK